MSKFEEKFSFFEKNILVGLVGGSIVYFCMLYVVINVIGRYVFHYPIQGMTETVGLLMVPLAYLSFSYGWSKKGTFISMEFLVIKLKNRAQKSVALFVQFVTLMFFILPLSLGGIFGTSGILWAFRQDELVGTVGTFLIPTWPFRLLLVFGLIIMGIRVIIEIVKLFQTENVKV